MTLKARKEKEAKRMNQPETIKYKGKLYRFAYKYFGMGYDWPFYRSGKYMMVWRLEKSYPVCEFIHNE